MPVHWRNVKAGLDPTAYTLRTAPALLRKGRQYEQAVQWAAEQAALEGRGVLLVHAMRVPVSPWSVHPMGPVYALADVRPAGRPPGSACALELDLRVGGDGAAAPRANPGRLAPRP